MGVAVEAGVLWPGAAHCVKLGIQFPARQPGQYADEQPQRAGRVLASPTGQP